MKAWRWLLGHAPRATAAPGHTYADDFVDFLAHARGLDRTSAAGLVARSQAQFAGGWAGPEYRAFTERALEVLRPLHDETSDQELVRTYQAHAPLDFLRMLSYRIPPAAELSAIVDRLAQRPLPRLVDYGCGLAQRTIAVARALRARGVEVHLTLVDIRRETHVAFLDFVCRKYGVPCDFVEITAARLYPALPAHDYCDAVNVLEHVADPVRVIDNVDAALRPGGLFLASVHDQAPEMMHISPNLGNARARLRELGYAVDGSCCDASLFTKPDDHSRDAAAIA